MHAFRSHLHELAALAWLAFAAACGDGEESDDEPSPTSWTAGSASGPGSASSAGDEPDECREDGSTCSAEADCCDELHCIRGTCGTCSADYPVFCAEDGAIPASCWTEGTDCSTATDCAGDLVSCKYDVLQVDCSTKTCECPNPEYPDFCPPLGDVPASCWSDGVECSTVVDCNGVHKGCSSSEYVYDCDSESCVPTGGGSSASGGSASGGGDDSSGCIYDSECSYDEICRYGECVEAECTHDSDCYGNCERCSDNMCIYCGEGPYGCFC